MKRLKTDAITVICLTGEAGAGKSYVSKLISDRFNIPVIDSDSVAKELMQPGHDCYELVVNKFGEEYLDKTGKIDRAKLGQLVFGSKEALQELNSVTHSAAVSEINNRIYEYEKAGYKMVAVESAIAIECDFRVFCDEFWYVYADEETRISRLKERGYSDEKIRGIISSQSNEAYFREKCDKVIDNSYGVSDDVFFNPITAFIN